MQAGDTPSQPQNEQRGSWRADGPEGQNPRPAAQQQTLQDHQSPDAALPNRAQLLKQAADPAYQEHSVSVDKSMGVLKPTQPATELRQVILVPSLPRKHVCLQHLDVPLKPQTLGGEGSEPTLGAGPAPLAHLPSPRGPAKGSASAGTSSELKTILERKKPAQHGLTSAFAKQPHTLLRQRRGGWRGRADTSHSTHLAAAGTAPRPALGWQPPPAPQTRHLQGGKRETRAPDSARYAHRRPAARSSSGVVNPRPGHHAPQPAPLAAVRVEHGSLLTPRHTFSGRVSTRGARWEPKPQRLFGPRAAEPGCS